MSVTDPFADLDLDLEPKAFRLTIGGQPYLAREASEDAACRFHNAATRAARMTDGKVTAVDGIADCEPVLVAGCLFKLVKVKGAEVEQPVSVHEVRAWPARVVKPLFERLKKLSGLDEDTEAVLERRLKDDAEKLEKLRAGRALPKDSPGGGGTTSPSAATSDSPSTG